MYFHNPAAVLGKVEGAAKKWHGHVTAVTVAPAYRRQGLAKKLMDELENTTESMCVWAGRLLVTGEYWWHRPGVIDQAQTPASLPARK